MSFQNQTLAQSITQFCKYHLSAIKKCSYNVHNYWAIVSPMTVSNGTDTFVGKL